MPPTVLERCIELGFAHHVFISWPHQLESRGVEFVRAFALGLEDKFRSYGGGSVYVDDRIQAGYHWDSTLRRSLCRSAVTVSIIVPAFFRSQYCSIEWSISEQLTALRLPREQRHISGFLPILLTGNMPLPHEVADLQLVSAFLPLLAHSRKVAQHPSWPRLLTSVTEQVFEILGAIGSARVPPDWETQERLALAAQPKKFTWVPPRFSPGVGPRKDGGLPGFVVESPYKP